MIKRTYKRARPGEESSAPTARAPLPLPPAPSPPVASTGLAGWRDPFATCPFPRTRESHALQPATAAHAASGGSTQLHLDLGQRVFDSTRCALCGMLYCPGDAGDEHLHAEQCARAGCEGLALSWPLHARDDCVGGLGEGAAQGGGGARVLRMPPVPAPTAAAAGRGDFAGLQARATAIALHLLKVLGPHSLPLAQGDGAAPEGAGATPPVLLHYFFAVAGGGGVMGGLCAHALHPQEARLVQRGDGSGSSSSSSEQGAALVMSKDAATVRAVLGVDQVWVAPSGRRKGVARALLDAARAHVIHAFVVPRAEVAFSQPTGDGFALAAAYRGTPGAVPVFGGDEE